MKKIKVFECFAGVGSQRMALRDLGIDYEVIGISEIDKFALKSYEAIHGDCPNFGDISKINPNDLPDMDLLTYSFPCQDLSTAGKQQGLGNGTRSGLLYECEKIIEVKKPKYLLLENVKNLVGSKFKEDFDKWLEYLEGLGYSNYWKVLNSKDYGTPQNRERVFVVSVLDDNANFCFPKPFKLLTEVKDLLENKVEAKYYLSEEIQNRLIWFPKERLSKSYNVVGTVAPNPFDKDGNIIFDKSTRSWVYSEDTKLMSTLSATDYKQPKQVMLEDRIRKLTPLEYWRLMSFSDEDFYKAKNAGISNSQLYKQAGNSIDKNILKAIFRNMFINM